MNLKDRGKKQEEKEVILDFSKMKKDEDRKKAVEEYSRKARESGYVKRKRRELKKRGKELE